MQAAQFILLDELMRQAVTRLSHQCMCMCHSSRIDRPSCHYERGADADPSQTHPLREGQKLPLPQTPTHERGSPFQTILLIRTRRLRRRGSLSLFDVQGYSSPSGVKDCTVPPIFTRLAALCCRLKNRLPRLPLTRSRSALLDASGLRSGILSSKISNERILL